MITYNDIFNDKIISDILAIKREAQEKLSKFPSGGLVGNPDNIEAVLEGYKISAEYKNKLKDILKKNKENDIKNIYVLYYFGRSFIDGSMSKTTSFNDLLEHHKNDTFEQILRKIHDVQYEVMETCWKTAKEKFNKHEQNVTKEKEVFNKRLKLYTKKEGFNFFKFHKKPNKQSTNKVFKDIFNSYNIQETTDIYLAKELLEKIIEETNGLVVVDFLGSENFDHLDYVENDDEILKIYWKYSWGNNENPIPPHNIRVDIAFEKLELIEYSNTNVAVALKGYFRNKKEIRQYYHNKEKINKMYSFDELKWSLFYNELNFDKKQRGSIENFRVTFLPWRYYNILILPKENLPSVGGTTKILILKNLIDIKKSLNKTFNDFQNNFIQDEDYITMYGNRFRKLVEKLLKFILLASKIMFKENYEKDMLGNILVQIKSEVSKKENSLNSYDKNMLHNIIKKLETDGLLDKLNLCSHDNVKHKITQNIIENIYNDINLLIKYSYKYFKFNV